MSTEMGWRAATGRSFVGPGKYVQNPGEMKRLAEHVAPLGKKVFALVDKNVLAAHGEAIKAALASLDTQIEPFGGECHRGEIDRVTGLVHAAGSQVVVGIGGGKTLDTGKMAAIATDARIVTVPTIASTDAPTSAIAVRYNEEGFHQEAHLLPRNPDAVIVDSAVIVQAPVRFLVAGIGDALSTWFEARSNLDSRSSNLATPRFPAPEAGIAIAKQCHEVLMRDAVSAVHAARLGALTPAVEAIIEANTLLSGLGFENCGVSGAHGIHDGLTALPPVKKFWHGEKVAFGVLCMLVLEGRPLAEFAEVAAFCRSVGLPTRLADLDLAGATKEDIAKVGEASLKPGSSIFRCAVPLSPVIVADAIRATDALSTKLAA